VALHAAILFGLLWPWPQAPVAQEPPAMTISLYQGPPKEAKPAPPAPAAQQEKKPPPRPKTARPPKVPTDVEPVP
jgi:hypothetical protein